MDGLLIAVFSELAARTSLKVMIAFVFGSGVTATGAVFFWNSYKHKKTAKKLDTLFKEVDKLKKAGDKQDIRILECENYKKEFGHLIDTLEEALERSFGHLTKELADIKEQSKLNQDKTTEVAVQVANIGGKIDTVIGDRSNN